MQPCRRQLHAVWGVLLAGEAVTLELTPAHVLQNTMHPAQFLKLRYRSHLSPASSPLLNSSFNIAAIQQLFASVDFIGISSYSSLAPGFEIHEVEAATTQFVQEMALFGVDIEDLIFNKVRLCPASSRSLELPHGSSSCPAVAAACGDACSQPYLAFSGVESAPHRPDAAVAS